MAVEDGHDDPARTGLSMTIGRGLLAGLAGGAAGTTALNAVTYLDMAIRGAAPAAHPRTPSRRSPPRPVNRSLATRRRGKTAIPASGR